MEARKSKGHEGHKGRKGKKEKEELTTFPLWNFSVMELRKSRGKVEEK
jgi:hypothetical protein